MKTVILAGLDNLTFTAADLLNPKEYKLIGYASEIEQAWNIYGNNGEIVVDADTLPIMPIAAAVGYEPDLFILAANSEDDNEHLKYVLYRMNYCGEVLSLYDLFAGFSLKTAAIRKLSWRLNQLGIEGAIADLGAGRGDISWQMNALFPERTLYLFDTFTGFDERDIKKEQEMECSNAKIGEYALSQRENDNLSEIILGRMPYREKVMQERSRRAGTENVPGIVGLGCAIEIAAKRMSAKAEQLSELRDRLIDGILALVPGSCLNGPRTNRLAGNANISFPGVDAELLLRQLESHGILASSGAACSSGQPEPRHSDVSLASKNKNGWH